MRTCNENDQLWRKEMIPLTSEELDYYEMQKVCHIYKKGLWWKHIQTIP